LSLSAEAVASADFFLSFCVGCFCHFVKTPLKSAVNLVFLLFLLGKIWVSRMHRLSFCVFSDIMISMGFFFSKGEKTV